MSADWDEFAASHPKAIDDQVAGDAEPWKALWSQSDDVVIMGADGLLDKGRDDVTHGIELAAGAIHADGREVDSILTLVGEDMAVTVDIEKVAKQVGGTRHEIALRCTHVYRLEDGEWKVVVRHADRYVSDGPKRGEPGHGPPAAGPPGGGPPGGGPPGGGPPGGGPPG
jgi:ketosteroid isomerase-like protein